MLLSKKTFSAFFGQESHAHRYSVITFFPDLRKSVQGNLKKIAAIGYKEVESAFSLLGGFYGKKSTEFASIVNDAGLSWNLITYWEGLSNCLHQIKCPRGLTGSL